MKVLANKRDVSSYHATPTNIGLASLPMPTLSSPDPDAWARYGVSAPSSDGSASYKASPLVRITLL